MKIQPGQAAPDFTLYDSDKNKVSLHDFRGKTVLLLFFPQAFTSVCTQELCSVRDSIGLFEDVHAQVLGISVDSVFTLAKYKEEQSFNFPLLSDFNKEVSAAYGSLYDVFAFEMRGVSRRSAFVIDQEGIVRYAEVLESAGDIPNFNAIRETIESLAVAK